MLTPEELKSLNKRSAWRPYFDIGLCWAMIAGCLYLCNKSLLFLPLAVPVIASRLHGLVVIMHDGAHNLISKNSVVNDFVSNVFCSFPLQLSTEIYRKSHYKHHQYTQTPQDPNFVIMQREEAWHFPKPKEEVKKILLKDLLVMTMKEHMVILKEWQVLPNFKNTTKLEKYLFPVFILSFLGATAYFGLWKEFFILQGSSLLINPIVRMRAMSEHIHHEATGQTKMHKLHETPTINASFLERFFIAPFNTNRHLEHHVYPTIPYYNLEKAHELVSKTQLYKDHCWYELDGYLMGKRTSLDEVLAGMPTHPGEKLKTAA
jgi:fatty acid desaturase